MESYIQLKIHIIAVYAHVSINWHDNFQHLKPSEKISCTFFKILQNALNRNYVIRVSVIQTITFTCSVMVKMKNLLNSNTWLWERGKFMNRRYIMQVRLCSVNKSRECESQIQIQFGLRHCKTPLLYATITTA